MLCFHLIFWASCRFEILHVSQYKMISPRGKKHIVKCTFFFLSLSPFHLSISPPAWGFVGQGSNMHSRSSYSVNPPKVIVSRSHSGKVKSYVQDAFGNSTTVIEAGGAGEWRIFEHRYITCKSIAWCRWSSKKVWSKQTVNYRNCEFDRLSALDTFIF